MVTVHLHSLSVRGSYSYANFKEAQIEVTCQRLQCCSVVELDLDPGVVIQIQPPALKHHSWFICLQGPWISGSKDDL
jgi:hypothetical protein